MHKRSFIRRGLANVVVVATAFLTGTVSAIAQQPGSQDLRDRLNRLERDIRSLNREVYRNPLSRSSGSTSHARPSGIVSSGSSAGTTAFVARIEQRIGQMEADLRAVTGSVEKMVHNLGQISPRLDKLVGDVDFRLSKLEAQARAAPTRNLTSQTGQQSQLRRPPQASASPAVAGVQQVGPQTGGPVFGTGGPGTLGTITGADLRRVAPGSRAASSQPASLGSRSATTAPRAAATAAPGPPKVESAQPQASPPPQAVEPKVLPNGTPRQRYNFAFSLLRQADYTKAATAFQEFVDAHPKDQLTPNASYWLGETFYVRGAYARAAEIFLAGYQSTPNGQKAPDSLLKLGMSLIALDKKREACATFDKLTSDFPNAPNNVRRVLDRQRKRAICRIN